MPNATAYGGSGQRTDGAGGAGVAAGAISTVSGRRVAADVGEHEPVRPPRRPSIAPSTALLLAERSPAESAPFTSGFETPYLTDGATL